MSATHLLVDGTAACGHAGDSPISENEDEVTCTLCRRSFGKLDAETGPDRQIQLGVTTTGDR